MNVLYLGICSWSIFLLLKYLIWCFIILLSIQVRISTCILFKLQNQWIDAIVLCWLFSNLTVSLSEEVNQDNARYLKEYCDVNSKGNILNLNLKKLSIIEVFIYFLLFKGVWFMQISGNFPVIKLEDEALFHVLKSTVSTVCQK